jgi:hypothetical protein
MGVSAIKGMTKYMKARGVIAVVVVKFKAWGERVYRREEA